VAELLERRFPRAVHVHGGQFYRWAVSGWIHFDGDDQAEAGRLLDLRYRLSALVADQYASAGFTVVVLDNIYGADVVRWLDRIEARPVNLVVLRPTVGTIEQRHEQRRQRLDKVAYRGAYTAALNDRDVATTPHDLRLWLDTSDQRPDATVEEIVAPSADALVR